MIGTPQNADQRQNGDPSLRLASGSGTAPPRGTGRLFAVFFILGGCWFILAEGSKASWLVGMPTLAAAVWAWSRLNADSNKGISLSGLINFAPLFVWESLRGGWDVVSRTLTVKMRIEPGFLDFKTRLKTTSARTFFVNCVGLLPGTLAADMHDDRLEIHALYRSGDLEAELRRLEAAVARLLPQEGRRQ